MIGRYVDSIGNYHAVFLVVGVAALVGMAAVVAADALAAKSARPSRES